MKAAIEQRIREYLADTDPRFDWVRAKVREEYFLPLFLDFLITYGIRPDLTLVSWEDGADDVKRLVDGPAVRRDSRAGQASRS